MHTGISGVSPCGCLQGERRNVGIGRNQPHIKGPVGDKGPEVEASKERVCPCEVARLARNKDKANKVPESIADGDVRAGQAAPGAADGLVPGPQRRLVKPLDTGDLTRMIGFDPRDRLYRHRAVKASENASSCPPRRPEKCHFA